MLRRPGVAGVLVALGAAGALSAMLFPLRSEVSSATTALVLVVPVVAGVSVGGFLAGLVAAGACFFLYDLLFLPPYYSLYVASAADWVALAVYAAVAVIVARVVAVAKAARADSQRRTAEMERLFDVSELLVREEPVGDLLERIVATVRSTFDLEGVALLMPVGGRLQLVASAGEPLSPEEVAHLSAGGATPVSLGPLVARRDGQRTPQPAWQAVALVAGGKAVGLLAVRGAQGSRDERELVRAFANHLALALERATLREEALRARVLEEVDQLRRALVGAVSHDLRTPLATIKLSASTLLESAATLGPDDMNELAGLVDAQANRLDRLVTNLLDMTRIQAGALELRRQPSAVPDLVDEALGVLGRSGRTGDVCVLASDDLPPADVDPVLVRQALANLLDNAFRYSPAATPVTVEARRLAGGKIEVSVSDHGPGLPGEERGRIFQMFERREAGGRGGLGLAIAQAFIEAHGEVISAGKADGGGARFAFTLPAVSGVEG